MHRGIATAIASDFLLNRRQNRKEFLQREANLPFFIAKCIATVTVSLPQRNRNLFPRKNRCVQFDHVIADFDCESSPGDGALSSREREGGGNEANIL